MKLLQNLIAIKLKPTEEKKTKSGLYIPESKWGDRRDLAFISELPPHSEYPFKIDDLVLINPYAVIDTPTEDLKLIKPQDILAIWE
jgi:co-chaperonin GroES (HSP10)